MVVRHSFGRHAPQSRGCYPQISGISTDGAAEFCIANGVSRFSFPFIDAFGAQKIFQIVVHMNDADVKRVW